MMMRYSKKRGNEGRKWSFKVFSLILLDKSIITSREHTISKSIKSTVKVGKRTNFFIMKQIGSNNTKMFKWFQMINGYLVLLHYFKINLQTAT